MAAEAAAEMVSSASDVLREFCSSSLGSSDASVPGSAKNQALAYRTKWIVACAKYVDSEFACVKFMAARVKKNALQLKKRSKELSDIRGLGMLTLENEVSDHVEKLKANIAEDEGCKNALLAQAAQTLRTFKDDLAVLKANDTEALTFLTTKYGACFRSIRDHVDKLESCPIFPALTCLRASKSPHQTARPLWSLTLC